MFPLKNKKGFLLIEVVIVVSVIAIAILASMSAAQKSKQLSEYSVQISQANFLLEEGAEIIRILRDNGWNNISVLQNNTDYYFNLINNTWSLDLNNSENLGIFTRKVNISDIYRDSVSGAISLSGNLDSGTKLISVFITWNQGGKTINKKLEFYLSNILL